jgi:hypothetical protein
MTVNVAFHPERDIGLGDYRPEVDKADIEVGDAVEFKATIPGTYEPKWLPGKVTGIDRRVTGRPIAYWIRSGRAAYRVLPKDVRLT